MTRRPIPKRKLKKSRTFSKTRVAAIRDELRQNVSGMFLEGATVQETAKACGITCERVRELMDEATDLFKRKCAKDILEHRAIELAKIDHLEREAWKAWHSSKLPQTCEVYKCTDLDDVEEVVAADAPKADASEEVTNRVGKMLRAAAKLGVQVNARKRPGKKQEFREEVYEEAAMYRQLANEIEFRKQTRDGNPVFMSIITKCQERRAALLGLDEAKRWAGLLEFRVAGVAQEELDRQMIELVAEQLAAVLHPSEN